VESGSAVDTWFCSCTGSSTGSAVQFLEILSHGVMDQRRFHQLCPTFSFDAAVTCSSASVSVLAIHRFRFQHIFAAQNANRASKVGFADRRESSRATSGVSFVLVGRDICRRVLATTLSRSTFRKGDCRRETLSGVLSVSSKIASPVLYAGKHRLVRLGQTVKVLRSDPSLWLHYFGIAKPQVTPEFDTHTHFGEKREHLCWDGER
jgi:hypothetical protein